MILHECIIFLVVKCITSCHDQGEEVIPKQRQNSQLENQLIVAFPKKTSHCTV